MWTETEAAEIERSISLAWERVKRLAIPADFVLSKQERSVRDLYERTVKIESELTPVIPYAKALAMLTTWEMTWRQIESKLKNGRRNHVTKRK